MDDLKKILKSLNITDKDIADELELKSINIVNLKLSGKSNFTTKEATKLKKLINTKSDRQYTIEELFS